MIRQNQTEEPPKYLSPKNVCYWAEKEGILIGSQEGKAKKLLSLGLVEKTGEFSYTIHPIKGYNITTHYVNMKDNTCTCQFNRRFNEECAHIKAVILLNFMQDWGK